MRPANGGRPGESSAGGRRSGRSAPPEPCVLPPSRRASLRARPSADHRSTSRLDGSGARRPADRGLGVSRRRTRGPASRGFGSLGRAEPSARRLRLANSRVCITQCAGSRTATLDGVLQPAGPQRPVPADEESRPPSGSSVRRKPQSSAVYRRGRRRRGSNCRPRRSSDMRRARNRSGSSAATCQDWLPSGLPVTGRPGGSPATRDGSGPRCGGRTCPAGPSCTSRRGRCPSARARATPWLGGASMVTAIVARADAAGTRSPPGSATRARRRSPRSAAGAGGTSSATCRPQGRGPADRGPSAARAPRHPRAPVMAGPRPHRRSAPSS